MKIAVSDQGFFFAFFYILSFTTTFLVVVAFCIRRKISLTAVLIMLTTVSLMVILGSRLLTIPVRQWGQLIITGVFEDFQGRFAVGGLLFGIAGLILSVNLLRIDRSIIRLYGWLTPVGFGLQKIGCFFNGCCYGNLSGLPWSVKYPVCTNAHYHQWAQGLIGENAAWSLPVHPVQIYEALCFFLISFIVWKTKDRWRKNWSVLIFSVCLFCLCRFATEFFRDTSATYVAYTFLWGIKKLQWILLLSGLALAIMLYVNEKIRFSRTLLSFSSAAPLGRSVIYLIVVSAVIYVFRGLFSKFELISLDMKLIPAVLLMAVTVFKSLPEIRLRLATTSYLVLPLLFITLTFPQDTLKTHSPVESYYRNEVKAYTRIDPGAMFGKYYSGVSFNPHEGYCGTTYTQEDYKHEFRMGGIGISRVKYIDDYIITYGVSLFGGTNKEYNITLDREKTFNIIGIGPFVEYDLKWIGVGAGINMGNLRWAPIMGIDELMFENGTRYSPVMPEGYLRVGVKDYVYGRYSYGFNPPSSFPVLTHELSLGSGFGHKHSLDINSGVGITRDFLFPFIKADVLLSRDLGLNLRYNFGKYTYSTSSPYYESITNHHSWLSVGMNYRFGFKE